MAVRCPIAFFVICFSTVVATKRERQARSAINPIRKVVAMLQEMERQVTEEGAKDKEIYEKYMCYCKSSGSDLTKSIAAAEAKISSLPSEIEAAEEEAKQAAEALKQAKADRAAAVEKGMAGTFLQTDSAKSLQRLANSIDMDEDKRESLLAFLQGNPFSQGYAPKSGEIDGILKELGDDMGRDLADATKVEEEAINIYNELM